MQVMSHNGRITNTDNDDVESMDVAAMLLATFAEMRKADFRYECSELVEWVALSSWADALTVPAA